MHQVHHCPRCGGETTQTSVEGKARPVCGSCGFTIYLDPKLAVAVVIEREGRLLLGLRGEGTREPGKWSFPAGFVDRGEIVEMAAIREIREETGLTLESLELLDLISREGEAVVLAVYVATSHRGNPVPADDLVEVGWFDPHELPDLAFPHDPAIVNRWKRWRDRPESSGNS